MTELFQRPANYWLRHADRHKQSGDLIRAAVLQRHAMRAEPGSDAARMQYALTLRQLHCYEASNREAFCALAHQPELTELYGLIGCNMLNMGMRREGLDALGVYMNTTGTASAPWHDEACDLSEVYDYPFPEHKRQARLNGLLRIAAHRMARGDLDGAGRALSRAQQTPYRAANPQRDLVQAVYWINRQKPERCIAHLQRALEKDFFDVASLTSAAVLSRRMGTEIPARMLLVRAASLARTPAEFQLVCHTAASLDMVFIAHGMLKRASRRRSDRCPLLYDLCVCALKMGRLQEAARHIHLCREIDPDDVPSETLFGRVMAWQERSIAPKQLRREAKGVSFSGSCTDEELSAFAAPFLTALQAEPFTLDQSLRRRLLFLLTLPVTWPVSLLQLVCERLSPPEQEALLREVLMQHPAERPAKRFAMNALRHMGAPAPYAVWTRDRFLLADPERLFAPIPTFRQRLLTLRIRQAVKLSDPQLIPWALKVISRMSHARQCHVIGDHWKIWPLALAMRWRALHGLPPVQIPFETMSPLRLRALHQALAVIRNID